MSAARASLRAGVAVAMGAGLLGLCWLVAASVLSPRTERMQHDGAAVDVEYATSASAADLGLPVYPEAAAQDSFCYTVKSKDGKPVMHYASAILTSSDAPDKVVATYREKLPGHPEASSVKDEVGTGYLLAVGDEAEVRTVTVTQAESGSRIELVRATRPAAPRKPVTPRRRERAI